MVTPSLPGEHDAVTIASEVRDALAAGRGVVALESAVLTHGLPEPQNLDALDSMDRAVRDAGAIPALCLVCDGRLHVGAGADLAARVAANPMRQKASVRDLGYALARGASAGLTVSATLFAAHRTGISVFATGGIGGVHVPHDSADVSADLLQLSRTPVVTVCAGAKSVLDMPRTIEVLESLGVPVYCFESDEFPAFYLRSSEIQVPRLDCISDIARVARAHWGIGLDSGIVLGNPIPAARAIAPTDWSRWLHRAQQDASSAGISGKDVTPFLLARVAALSGGRTVEANLALLEANAALAGRIAVAFQQ